jgi:hypothetical protein
MNIEVADTTVATAVEVAATHKMVGCRADPDPLPLPLSAKSIGGRLGGKRQRYELRKFRRLHDTLTQSGQGVRTA